MKLVVKVLTSEKFNFNDKSYVRITGLVNGKQCVCFSVKEELVPDSLENKELTVIYGIGFDNRFRPYLKLENIELGSKK